MMIFFHSGVKTWNNIPFEIRKKSDNYNVQKELKEFLQS